ncbi:hypothetical protein J2847_004092 [Azospirillum agricola]|uniref:hypothetical protein n=1 Tax=Azospirillum agricola TaxID=1720247 RepID=UPI001AE55795|nr:hypothetical protein [Azospirillum agricola]MBP2230783.1 hypothetical protein [Azospirillum agricola]
MNLIAATIPLGAPGLALEVLDGIAWVHLDRLVIDTAEVSPAVAGVLVADARRWILLGSRDAEAWFSRTLDRARQAGRLFAAAE